MNPNSMTPVDWAKRPLEKYADFTGRAPRAEYWWYFLGIVVAYILLTIIESILGIGKMVVGIYGPLTILLWLGTIVPGIETPKPLWSSGIASRRTGWPGTKYTRRSFL